MAEPTTAPQSPQAAQGGKAKKGRSAKLTDVRNSAFERARTTVEGLESNPVGVLVGGLAFGLIAGALIPRSEREKEALRPVGKRLAQGAVAAVAAAKETGKEHLTASMLGKDAARNGARAVFESALTAARGGSPAKSSSATADEGTTQTA